MKNKENKNSFSKYTITLLSLAVLFLISFSTSAWIYIKSNDLVFIDTIEEYEEKYKKVTETEEKIEELEAQVERYKSMYEGAIKDNKLLSSPAASEISTEKKETENTKTDKETDKKTEKEEELKTNGHNEKTKENKKDSEETEKKETVKKETENKTSDEKDEE